MYLSRRLACCLLCILIATQAQLWGQLTNPEQASAILLADLQTLEQLDRTAIATQAATLRQANQRELATWIEQYYPDLAANETHQLWLPKPRTTPEFPVSAAAELASWQQSRQLLAERYWELARRAIRAQHLNTAWTLLHRTIYADPTHAAARKILGYQLEQQTWQRPPALKLQRAGMVNHPQFGWLPADYVKRYEQGSRFYRGKWLSIEAEAPLHANINNGWRIETEHYVLTTNHSLEEGLRMARRLEELCEAWQQLFPGYFLTAAELVQRYQLVTTNTDAPKANDLRPWPWEQKKFQVVLFTSREEYNQALKPAQANIGVTLGIYFASTKTAYFFCGEDQDPGTVWHEATHQLFQESRVVSNEAGSKGGFWMLEGVACYLETLATVPQGWTVGGPQKPRLLAARQRLLKDDFYLPIGELTSKSMRELQSDQRLPMIYSQSAGLWQFLMHAEQGRYREPALRVLQLIYANKSSVNELNQAWGVPTKTLDQQYRQYLEQF